MFHCSERAYSKKQRVQKGKCRPLSTNEKDPNQEGGGETTRGGRNKRKKGDVKAGKIHVANFEIKAHGWPNGVGGERKKWKDRGIELE